MSAKGESWVKEEGRRVKKLFCIPHMACACYCLPEKCKKKIGLFCRVPFFKVEEAE